MSDTAVTFEDGSHHQGRMFAGLALSGVTFTSVEFDGCLFERCTLAESVFYRCSFADCRFVACDLSLAAVPNSRFAGVRFERTKAIGIDWTKAGTSQAVRVMMSLQFADSVLNYSSFFGLSLRNGMLERCTAHEVDFAEADLSGAHCGGTDFAGSTFLHTNLERADFTGAINYAIDPTANRVKGARFSLPDAVALLRGFDIVIEQ